MLVKLKNILEELLNGIDDYRLSMYELAKNKGLSDPEVIKISQQLDKKIFVIKW
jgi:hypothetical protein